MNCKKIDKPEMMQASTYIEKEYMDKVKEIAEIDKRSKNYLITPIPQQVSIDAVEEVL